MTMDPARLDADRTRIHEDAFVARGAVVLGEQWCGASSAMTATWSTTMVVPRPAVSKPSAATVSSKVSKPVMTETQPPATVAPQPARWSVVVTVWFKPRWAKPVMMATPQAVMAVALSVSRKSGAATAQ